MRLHPLGGLGEFGLNALVVEWDGHLLLVDAGVLFATADLPGVDSIVPDFQYLAERRDRLHAIVLTHGHEDHIGALAFALGAAPAPVYGSALTLGFARRRLLERGVEADLRVMAAGQAIEAGPFRVHAIPVAHSVSGSYALAIETPAGVVLHSGDFKIRGGTRAEERTDVDALSAWGDRGVLALLADSTNVEWTGHTGAEDEVLPAFAEVFAQTSGRVLVTCFATAIPRIQRVAEMALAAGRSLGFLGRRLGDNVEVARELGLIDLPPDAVVPAGGLRSVPPGRLAVFVAGSQGEPFSALSVLAHDEHRDLSVGPGDTAVISARAVPGNERAVSRLMGNLFRRGCHVVHGGTAHVHVSGHGSREDLLELLRRVRPRYLVPIHGEYRMLAQHARLAAEAGFPSERVLVAEDGDVLALGPAGALREARLPAGRVLLDRSGTEGVEDEVVRDRRHLSAEGIVVPVVVVDKLTGALSSDPEIVTRGFVAGEARADLLADAGQVVVHTLAEAGAEERQDPDAVRERIRLELRRFFRRRLQRRPMVIPVVMEV